MEKSVPGRGVVLLGATAAGLLVAQQVAGKATRDALFLSHYPASALPAVMAAACPKFLERSTIFKRASLLASCARISSERSSLPSLTKQISHAPVSAA